MASPDAAQTVSPESPRTRASRVTTPGWTARIERVLADPALVRPALLPIFDITRGRVSGFEALARFAAGPLHSPVEWLSAASERGLESAFEAALLEAALRGRASLPVNCFLSVNISPDAMLSQEVRGVIARAG